MNVQYAPISISINHGVGETFQSGPTERLLTLVDLL